MRFALDSNILIYAEGADDEVKRLRALSIIGRIGRGNIVLPAQTLGETLRWLIRKAKLERKAAVDRIAAWRDQCEPLGVSTSAFDAALGLVGGHGFQVWDAVILAATSEARAQVLLSEDLQHGFRWNGVTVVDPFVLTEDEVSQLTAMQATVH